MNETTILLTDKNITENVTANIKADNNLKEQKININFVDRVTFLQLKILILKTKWLVQSLRRFLKGDREPLLGGGGSDFELWWGYEVFFASAIVGGVFYDGTKLAIKKIYKHIKSRHTKYITITHYQENPFDTNLRILLPNNLPEQDLDWILDCAEKIFNAIKPVRGLFGYKKVIIKYNKRWHIKFKSKF
ncbi:MAG: hypothetical protein V1661_03380 [bacterium]